MTLLTSDITGAARLHRAAPVLMDGLGVIERICTRGLNASGRQGSDGSCGKNFSIQSCRPER